MVTIFIYLDYPEDRNRCAFLYFCRKIYVFLPKSLVVTKTTSKYIINQFKRQFIFNVCKWKDYQNIFIFLKKYWYFFIHNFIWQLLKNCLCVAPPRTPLGVEMMGGGVEMIIILIKNLLMENHVFVLRMVDPILEQNYD